MITKPGVKNTKSERARAETGKVIVKAEGKTYAELLKRVKNNVNLEQAGIDIKRVKRTQNGDLLLEVEDREKATKLKETINRNLEDVNVIQKTNEVTLHITNIDGDIEENELKEEIKKNNKDIGDTFQILALRQMRNGNKAATIKAEKRVAEGLLKTGKIRIGWVQCEIRKRVQITRCFRCLGYGHRTGDCQGEDKSDVCIKCGKKGHVAKDCSNPPYCTTCNRDGHRADQMGCPIFRKLISQESRKRASRKITPRNGEGLQNPVFTN
ncbi:hypothetical protein NQ317_018316 [Molorchus minor]|uniref:CCHC-type domain-containing protein n=1 Tax=Molorchus minor TaxID=1323400 RepID=A0ABQ9J195_9CUCU|nr:hypothetical protein NQ317_018316 [Molorchus minor]